jgi:uncharacterized phage protein gp47/JayE
LAYVAPFIGPQGLVLPSYADIQAKLLASFSSIYGQTVYLGQDAADYEFVSIIALMESDVMGAIRLAYNSRSPLTAVGAALDSIVKVNGLVRKPASFSTCFVTIAGTAGSVITSGIVQDINGFSWYLPSSVTIPIGGSVIVATIAANPGVITANPGDLSVISTPTAGWISVTNVLPAVSGQGVETDSQLRARQSISVGISSLTRLASTQAAIAATLNVTRYNVLNNPTGVPDVYGNPAHSITAVVEGGADADIELAIFNKRGIGAFTNGTTSGNVTDINTGNTMPIRFYRPTYVPIYVSLVIHALAGYTITTQNAIQSAIVAYLETLQIGQSIIQSELIGAALTARPNPDLPMFSIRSLFLGVSTGPTGSADVAIQFSQVASGTVGNVVITLI